MSKWNKEELENMLEDVVNELDLSEIAVEKHGQQGTTPAELVRLVLEQKDLKIRALEANFVDASKSNCTIDSVTKQRELLKNLHLRMIHPRTELHDSDEYYMDEITQIFK